jgi:hypothetical protein
MYNNRGNEIGNAVQRRSVSYRVVWFLRQWSDTAWTLRAHSPRVPHHTRSVCVKRSPLFRRIQPGSEPCMTLFECV